MLRTLKNQEKLLFFYFLYFIIYYLFYFINYILYFFFIFHSSRPGLRPGSLDKNPKMNRETKNITTV